MSKYTGISGDRTVAVGEYKAVRTTLADGDRGELQVDTNGFLVATLGTAIKGEDLTNDVMKVEEQYGYTYISTATTTVIRTGSGMLHTIQVQGGTTGTIIVYDNSAGSGTIIASFDTTNAIGNFYFDCKYSTGLTIVTSAATKLTVCSR
jgi:hypothetical protein